MHDHNNTPYILYLLIFIVLLVFIFLVVYQGFACTNSSKNCRDDDSSGCSRKKKHYGNEFGVAFGVTLIFAIFIIAFWYKVCY
jgi:amino acid permease